MGLRFGRIAALILLAGYMFYGTTAKADDQTVATPNNQEETKPVSQADKSSSSPVTLPEVLVTSPPLTDVNPTRYGDEVDTVSSGQLDDLNAQDLPTALRRVPGVIISQYNEIGNYGGGDGGSIYLRGQGSGRPGAEITTMVDGIPRFAGVWTHPLMDLLPVNNANEIEVYKSTQPVFLGNMGFGAINVVPKSMDQPGFETQLQSEAGANQTYIQCLEHGGKTGDIDYYLTGGHWISDGIRANSNGEVYEGSARLGVNLGSGVTASGYLEYNNSSTDDPGEVGVVPLPITQNFMFDSTLMILTLSHQDGPWSGSVKGYWDQTHINWYEWDYNNLSAYNSNAWSSNYGCHLKEKWASDGTEILLGFDNDYYGGHTQDIYSNTVLDDSSNPPQFANNAPYAMLSQSFELGGGVTLTPSAGVRYNISRYFGSIAGPQAGLKLDDSADSYYFGYAHGFNYPGVYVAIMSPQQWQNLQAEIDDHLEVGWNRKFSKVFSTNLAVFRDDVSNAIRVSFPPPTFSLDFQNIGSYRSQGIELDIQWTPKNLPQWFVGWTYLDTTPADVPNAPQWTFQSGMNADIADLFRLNLDIQYVSRQNTINPRFPGADVYVDGYIVLNGKLAYSLGPKATKNNTEIFVACENIGAEDYEFRPGYPMAKDAWLAGLDYKF